MRCHEVLGIDERATVSDIMLAYENKKTSLTDEHTSVSAEQIQAKLCELNSAKDNCIAWTNMDFASKTANRVKEYSADCFSQNRLNGICWCCPCCTPETSVLCDIAICAGVAFCIVGSIREKNEKHREEDAAKKATVLRDQATKRLSELRNDLGTTKKIIEEAGREYSDAEMTLNAYRMFTSFFYSLGCSYDGVPETTQKLLDDLVSKREKHSTLCAKQKEIEKRINEQERILQQNR